MEKNNQSGKHKSKRGKKKEANERTSKWSDNPVELHPQCTRLVASNWTGKFVFAKVSFLSRLRVLGSGAKFANLLLPTFKFASFKILTHHSCKRSFLKAKTRSFLCKPISFSVGIFLFPGTQDYFFLLCFTPKLVN